ncbi:MAG: PKD domain-containing protein [Planctomycetota bacterium]
MSAPPPYIISCFWAVVLPALAVVSARAAELPKTAHNRLVEARLSGNMARFGKGVRGKPNHIVYDLHRCRFQEWSPWKEYGVGLNEDLGVVPESQAAYWMAEWAEPVPVNYIRLSGAYPNQPQHRTAWKIEVRRAGKWRTHARGVGGWYHGRRYRWGGADTEPIRIDGFRVCLFSRDNKTRLRSIHFRGEDELSWVVGYLPAIDARIRWPGEPVREGRPVPFTAVPVAGDIRSWAWRFEDGSTAAGRKAQHAFDRSGVNEVRLTVSDGKETAFVLAHVKVLFPIEARIAPLTEPVLAGKPVEFSAEPSLGRIDRYQWRFGDGKTAAGRKVRHTFARPGVYPVTLTVNDATHIHDGLIILRVHTPRSLRRPAVHLDTDPSNGVDDQHYLAYALFSRLDVLAVNAVHHGGGQEPANRAAVHEILRLARHSGLAGGRIPSVYPGANTRLWAPQGGDWTETEPVLTAASKALLGSARGASPQNPVWWVAAGAATNLASAVIQARREELDLTDRVRVLWLCGTESGITGQFNGDNDPWAAYVLGKSGLHTWILPGPVAESVGVNKTQDAALYPHNKLGRYLLKTLPDIPPDKRQPLYDPTVIAAVIAFHNKFGWVHPGTPIEVGPPNPKPKDPEHPEETTPEPFAFRPTEEKTPLRLIPRIDAAAVKRDLFHTLNGKPTPLRRK